jgi:hypothetical protein
MISVLTLALCTEGKEFGDILMTVQFEFCNHSSVAFYGLTNAPVLALELHSALDLECRRVCGVPGYANKNQPLLVWSSTIIDYLSSG